MIGLSATPDREDGLDPFIELYFGKEKIVRLLQREHTVYKVKTGFKPIVNLSESGKVNWSDIMDQQSKDEERNNLIIKIIKYFKDRNILVLTKRVAQGEYILSRLRDEGQYATSLLGSEQTFDKEARILVATVNKCGCGFDFPKLDCLIAVCDLESYFIQVLGRIFRTKDKVPLVIELIDINPILEKHLRTRMDVYTSSGCKKIKEFHKTKFDET